jgi:glyoxylase-like metal-dependent hydrolase (beta-lactamase superfamily II)/rhodanese-related sulfurtransferase
MLAGHDRLIPLVDEGLGNSAYLFDLGDGRALAVDPSLDLRAVDAVATGRGLRVVYAAETHLHADFLSGARQLAHDHGTQILASAAGRRTFDHKALEDGDEVDLGGLRLRALATPGHTPEHLSYLLLDDGREVGVFTGGSLIVGAAARTDLISPDRTDELARAQYASLQRLATLPDVTAVWPTHGAGSFCSAPPGAARTSTIGAQKAGNPLLAAPDGDTFVRMLTDSLGSYPAYFARLGELNRHGRVVTSPPLLPPLDAAQVRRLLGDGAIVVDVRPVRDYPAGHILGSVAIPLRAQYATWLGWLIAPDVPIVIVRNHDQDPADILWPALNVGYTGIVGELAGGIAAWTADGGQTATIRVVNPGEMDTANVIDVRQTSETATGHLPGAHLVELGSLPVNVGGLPGEAVTVMCGHGERAATGASLLERAGRTQVSILAGGADDWARATGQALKTER